VPVAPPASQSAAPASAPGKAPPDRGKKKPFQGGGGMPRRRVREPVPSLVDTERFGSSVKLKELDDEIAGELEAAMGGMSAQDIIAAENSHSARAQAASGEHGRKQGKVLSVHGKDVFVEVPGGRSQGVLPLEQFPDGPPKPGATVEITIEGYDSANGLLILTRQGAAVAADWSSVAEGMVVEARVIETNKGGLAVDINGIRGFMPVSQIDLYRVEKTEDYVNQRLLCVVTEVKPDERNLVVSRRAYLEKQREEMREKMWQTLAEGQIFTGTVRSVRDFGAFVDLGGVDGLLHVSEISWQRVQDASQVLQPGQSVKVAVLKLDRDLRKISLTLKGLEANPWDTIEERLPVSLIAKGTVTRTTDFGAFVELEPGIEGLIHISELARQRVWRVTDIVKPGQEVQVKIVGLDKEARRISLSLRQVMPEEAPKAAAEDEEADAESGEAAPAKPRTTPLRGGIGEQSWTMPPTPEE
jgi:small subunit ribosomal protein S1